METNEIMKNEEVIEETTEETVKEGSHSGLRTAAVVGLAMVAGGLACEFVVKPVVANFKQWRANRKAAHPKEIIDGDFDDGFDNPEDSEE